MFPMPAIHAPARAAPFLFDAGGKLLYEHRDRGILGFAENMSRPLSFLDNLAFETAVGK
jgi:hypothetical protein